MDAVPFTMVPFTMVPKLILHYPLLAILVFLLPEVLIARSGTTHNVLHVSFAAICGLIPNYYKLFLSDTNCYHSKRFSRDIYIFIYIYICI